MKHNVIQGYIAVGVVLVFLIGTLGLLFVALLGFTDVKDLKEVWDRWDGTLSIALGTVLGFYFGKPKRSGDHQAET